MNTDIHTRSVTTRFSAAADSYEVHAFAQRRAAEELLLLLPQSIQPKAVLEIGCGTGLLTRALVRRFPQSDLHAIDISDRMIEHAKRSVQSKNLTWFVADILAFETDCVYDLIISNSALQWVSDLKPSFERIYHLTAPSGLVALAIMVYGTLCELHESRQRIAPHKPVVRKLATANQILEILSQTGMAVREWRVHEYKVHYRSATAFLQAIREQGLTGGLLSRGSLPLNRSELRSLMEDYDQHYGMGEQGVPATFKVLFVIATKGSI